MLEREACWHIIRKRIELIASNFGSQDDGTNCQNDDMALSAAQRQGVAIDTEKKFAGGQNKQHSAAKNTAKLDRETEELHHDTVSLDVSKLIQQARQAKGWTQKELATKINEKQQVINEYEAGKAIPNQQIMSKLERNLGVKLRGKDKGQPLGGTMKK